MKYNWEHHKIPTWINWIATNENGQIFGFINKPVLEQCSLGWESTNENHQPLLLNFLEPPEVEWKNSLEQKPTRRS